MVRQMLKDLLENPLVSGTDSVGLEAVPTVEELADACQRTFEANDLYDVKQLAEDMLGLCRNSNSQNDFPRAMNHQIQLLNTLQCRKNCFYKLSA